MTVSKQNIDVYRLWEAFVSGADVDLSGLRQEIAASWRRCRAAKVSPTVTGRTPEAPDVLSSSDEDLLNLCSPVVSFLSNALVGTGKVVTLTNRDAKILTTVGGTKGLDAAIRINGMPGALWDERTSGTNVAGTGIILGKPFEVKCHEHYVRELQTEWTCCSAPIFHPFENEIVGVLIIGMVGSSVHPEPLELAIHGTRLIRGLMEKVEMSRRQVLNNAFEGFVRRYPDSAVLSVDANGRVGRVDSRNCPFLGKQATLVGQKLEEFRREDASSLVSAAGLPLPQEIALTIGSHAVTAIAHPVSHGDQSIGHILLVTPPKPTHGVQSSGQTWTTSFSFQNIIGQSKLLRQALRTAQKAAETDYPILIVGETGTGKELFAHAIHEASERRTGPFVAFNCGTLSSELTVSEMCGYEPGAFTGADRRMRSGVLDMAHRGTLFLDELQDMEPKAQSLLLRFLEAGTFVRVGGLHPVKTDVRIIAATNLPLSELDKRRLVRPDLLYRINCISVEIPPLRERPEDIRLIGEYCLRGDLGFAGTVDAEIWQILQQREWPGNVRELRNVLLRSILGCADNRLTADQFLPVEPNPLSRYKKFRSADQLSADVSDDIDAVLHETNGNVREAARRLGIHWTTLYRRLAKEKAH